MADCLERDLQLQQDRVPGSFPCKGSVDISGKQGIVGAGDQHDAVLAFLVDDDGRVAGRKRIYSGHSLRVDAIFPQLADELFSPGVGSNAPQETGAGPKPGKSHGLVGSLAAGYQAEVSTQDGLSRSRKLFRSQHNVHVDAADHEDPGPFAHVLTPLTRFARATPFAGRPLQAQMVSSPGFGNKRNPGPLARRAGIISSYFFLVEGIL